MPSTGKPNRWRPLAQSLLFIVLCAVMLAFASSFASHLAEEWEPLAIGATCSLGAFALMWLFLRRDGLQLDDAGARMRRGSFLRMAGGFLLGMVLVAIQTALLMAFCHLHFERVRAAGSGAALVALAAYFALACREELAFHGYPLRRLEQTFGLWGAQFIVALLFAVEHILGGVTWVHSIFGAAVGSLLFGMAALATRGLAVPIGMHAAWNFGQWVLGAKGVPGIWRAVVQDGMESKFDRVNSISYVIVMVTATLVFWQYSRAVERRAAAGARDVSFR